VITRNQLLIGAGIVGGLATLTACKFGGDDGDDGSSVDTDSPRPNGGPSEQLAPSGLPVDLEDDRKAAIRMLRRSPIGAGILEEAAKNGTKIVYQTNRKFDSNPENTDAYGVEESNKVWIPYRTVRNHRDLALTLAHELTHAYQENYRVFSEHPDASPDSAPWAPPSILPLAHRPRGITRNEFNLLQMEAQAYIVEARVADELGILAYDRDESLVVRPDLSVMNMPEAVRTIGHDSFYGDRYERGNAPSLR
jgi:hypothetical protein